MNIQLMSRSRLDVVRYDRCVAESVLPMPYAFSAHLDVVASRWKVVVLGDYDLVMPIAYNRKLLGVPQIYHPFFAQQLGAFGRYQRDVVWVKAMLNALSKFYVRIQMQLNAANPVPTIPGWTFRQRTNFELDLHQAYSEIRKNYRKGHKANIKSAQTKHLRIERGTIGAKDFARLGVGQKGVVSLARLPELVELYGKDSIWVARLVSGEIGAFGFFPTLSRFVKGQERVVYMIGHTTALGRKVFSGHFLLDAVIHEYAGQGGIFDFEGSELPGVASFFRGFGPVDVPYVLAERGNGIAV